MRQQEYKNSLAAYLKEINRIPLLSNEEEIELATANNAKAREKLVQSNLRFVVSVAKRYQNQGLPLADLISEGNIGLINAAERFDVTKGFRFISYAVWWIRQSILKAIGEKSRAIRLPANRTHELLKIEKAKAQIAGEQYEKADTGSIASVLNMDKAMVETIINAASMPLSLDSPLGDDPKAVTIGEFLEENRFLSPEAGVVYSNLRTDIDDLLSDLKARDADILRYRFGLNGYQQCSLKEVGEIFGLTKERIRQIEKKALDQLRSSNKKKELAAYVA